MAGGPFAANIQCVKCGATADRTYEGVEDDQYLCRACGMKFGICWDREKELPTRLYDPDVRPPPVVAPRGPGAPPLEAPHEPGARPAAPMTLDALRAAWMSGDAVRVGRTVMESLTPAARVSKAAALLDHCRKRCSLVPAVEAVAALARTPGRWAEAHRAFDAVRDVTLRAERSGARDAYVALLLVAENTAKTIYNATAPSDPFDDDSPWWVVQNALAMAGAVRDAEFEDALWQVIVGGSDSP